MDAPEDELERLFRDCYADLVRFAVRRTAPERAEDVAAEVFVVAWRRRSDLPSEHGDARAWLFGVARRLLLAEQRTQARGRALRIRLDAEPEPMSSDPAASATSRVDLAAAWERLTSAHQEALALTALDGMTSPEAARVLGISPVAYRLRLMRARRALAAYLDLTDRSVTTPTADACLTEGA